MRYVLYAMSAVLWVMGFWRWIDGDMQGGLITMTLGLAIFNRASITRLES